MEVVVDMLPTVMVEAVLGTLVLVTTVLMVTGRGDGDVNSADDERDGGGNDDERGAGDTICAGSDLVYTDGDENPKLIQTIRLSKRGLRPCV